MTRTQGAPERSSTRDLLWWQGFAAVFLRLALATSFLSSVADRFGLWGPPGTSDVSWGDLAGFDAYVAELAPYLPQSLVTPAGWMSTIAEAGLGLTLLLGLATRISAVLSAVQLLFYAVSLAVFVDLEKPFSFSVYTAAAAGLALAVLPAAAYVATLDRTWRLGTVHRWLDASRTDAENPARG